MSEKWNKLFFYLLREELYWCIHIYMYGRKAKKKALTEWIYLMHRWCFFEVGLRKKKQFKMQEIMDIGLWCAIPRVAMILYDEWQLLWFGKVRNAYKGEMNFMFEMRMQINWNYVILGWRNINLILFIILEWNHLSKILFHFGLMIHLYPS